MVVPKGKQSTGIDVWYETPLPSGKNVVPLTGGAHSFVKVTGVADAVIVALCPKQISLSDTLEVKVGVVET